ncbi:unnamed protein product [Colias eurytheme]|nr:unnamed protein product [Colias eurytheme]
MDSDEETLLLLLLLRRRKRRKRNYRRIWEDPLSFNRLQESDYFVLFSKRLKNNPKKFRKYLRMSRPTFYELLHLVQADLKHEDTHLRLSVSPEERLVITIRYLATGCSLMDLHFSFRRGFSTVQKIVRETCQAIIKNLFYICMPPKRTEDWQKISKGFLENADFPNCIGAVDGKHIRIIKPCHSGSLYFNYKKYFSMSLLAVCDSNYKFIFVDVGSYGKSSDSTIFDRSQLRSDIEGNTLNIPQPKQITNNEIALPFTLIGDEAFPLSKLSGIAIRDKFADYFISNEGALPWQHKYI